jgi:hypothetical protein
MLDRVGSERRHLRSDDLAAELLDVVNESELRRFLGRLAAETARATGRPIPRDTARALFPILRRTAERTLPTLTLAVGDEPRAAAAAPIAQTAAHVFGLEPEGMNAEDRDFEIARRFVRFAEAALARVVTTSAPSPATAAVDAVARAGREFAPGLVPPTRSAAAAVTRRPRQAIRPEVA